MGIKHEIGKKIKNMDPRMYEGISHAFSYVRYYKRKNTKVDKIPNELEKRYKKITGDHLNITNPKSYSEKIQWLKLYDDNDLRTTLTDKVLVRDWIKEKIGEEYLIPVLGVYNHFDEIDFSTLPDKFVIKTNHSSGWNIIVEDKSKLDLKKARKKIESWLKLDYAYWSEYEIHYSPIKPKIIIEKFITDSKGELNDFKFLCFGGECKFMWMDFDRVTNHKRNVYDMNWNLQPWNQYTYGNYEGNVEKPDKFDEMCKIANTLCKGFRHVRVDLYNVDGKIYFGEMTFTNGSVNIPVRQHRKSGRRETVCPGLRKPLMRVYSRNVLSKP